ncbi:hypothetical protein BDZ97DRAFT_1777987 [Flammula alnicola]|nr:hypothetical protein BDZ97DRAFT_1777987 [Flammula alnicola]
MDSVFRSKTITEALLSPEREAGNITPHDYEASLNFLPNYHRQYPVLGAVAATALIYSFRSPKWNQVKSAATIFTFGFGGYGFGKMAFLSAHFNYLRSIENPHGFQKAMEHVQAQVGAPKAGIIIERPYEISPDDLDPDHTPDNESQLILPTASDSQSGKAPAQKPHTKWDEIRAANNRTAQNSSWDSLRQKHEREAVKPKANEDSLWDVDAPAEKVDTDQYASSDAHDAGDKYRDNQKINRSR